MMEEFHLKGYKLKQMAEILQCSEQEALVLFTEYFRKRFLK